MGTCLAYDCQYFMCHQQMAPFVSQNSLVYYRMHIMNWYAADMTLR